MSTYFIVKLVHVLSAALLFGTGLGTAFFMLAAWRHGDARALRVTARHVVLADWLFTAPAVVVQLVTGLWLTACLGIEHGSAWFIAVLGLFAIVGMCWLPVVWLQIRVSRLAEEPERRRSWAASRQRRLIRIWTALGCVAFPLMLVLFGLMVFKPGIGWILR